MGFMGFIDNLRSLFRTGYYPAPAEPRQLQTYSSFEIMSPEWAMIDDQRFIAEGHRKNALVYRCVEFVANAISQPVLRGMRESAGGQWEELPPLDALSVLLERPSEDYASQTRFIKQVIRSLLVTGECILYKAPGERTGQTKDLQRLPSNKVAVKRETSGRKVYLYHYDPAKQPKKLKAGQVIFLKLDDLENKDRGLAPLAAAAREADVDNAGADVRKAFLDNGAILSGILTTEEHASAEQLEAWAVLWRERYGGPKKAGKTPALAGGMKYQEIGTQPDKMAFPEVIGLSEARVCSAFGVEPILVGAKIGLDRSTYSNYETAEKAFWKNTVPALLTLLADEFTSGLTEPQDGRACRWDTDEVPALQEDVDSREQRYGRLLRNGSATINEYREAAGMEPVDDGDLYMLPAGVTLVHAGELDVDRTPETLKPENLEDDDEEEEEEDVVSGSSEAEGDEEEATERAEVRTNVRVQAYPTLERRLARAIEQVFGVQAEAVAEKVADTLDPNQLLDLTIEAERMAVAVRPRIRAILREAGEDAAKEVEPEGEFDAEDEEATSFLDTAPYLLGFAMAERTREIVGKTISDVQAEHPDGDWTTDEIAERLKELVVDRDRSNRAASTETVRTANRAGKIAFRQNGITEVIWRNGGDPCPHCEALDGKTVGVDEAFAELDEELTGTDGSTTTVTYERLENPPLHPNCDCYLEPKRS